MLKVEMIENGTVIDHIKAGKGKKVLDLLGIGEEYDHLVALVMNVYSKKKGKKDIVKIAGIYVKDDLANKVALVSPNATINIIKDSKVEVKHKVQLPEILEKIAKCPNPNCMTNEKNAGDFYTKFEKRHDDKYKCIFCERLFPAHELV
ncbi:MAG: aspartate carbamoyltransferase regulatory subunit [Candidatus ainarchaeum sp.]|nr:aspartate carbamoyltransferase regulatory subunit [Candidatus ainarchaeum sp.]